mmetsp:Transcript_13195/g.49335  ORF Transcript_13195/g.49335 Transcript_13195/m.49335 type:complete len:247 (-) Transcript_13195:3079-3819(-)
MCSHAWTASAAIPATAANTSAEAVVGAAAETVSSAAAAGGGDAPMLGTSYANRCMSHTSPPVPWHSYETTSALPVLAAASSFRPNPVVASAACSSVNESVSGHPPPSAVGQHSSDSATTVRATVVFSGSMLYVPSVPTDCRKPVPVVGSDSYKTILTHAGFVALYPALDAASPTVRLYPLLADASLMGAFVRFFPVRDATSVALIVMFIPPASSAGSNTSNETYDGFVRVAFSTGNALVPGSRSRK